MACEQLPLGIGQCLEFRANVVLTVLQCSAMHHPGSEQQTQGLWHQHHLQREMAAVLYGGRIDEADAALGQRHLARCADVAHECLCQRLAEQVDALVHDLQVVRQGTIALADMAQQMLGLEVRHMQLAEQIEQRRAVMQRLGGKRLCAGKTAKLECHRVVDTIVFAAFVIFSHRHGEPMAAVVP